MFAANWAATEFHNLKWPLVWFQRIWRFITKSCVVLLFTNVSKTKVFLLRRNYSQWKQEIWRKRLDKTIILATNVSLNCVLAEKKHINMPEIIILHRVKSRNWLKKSNRSDFISSERYFQTSQRQLLINATAILYIYLYNSSWSLAYFVNWGTS